jgi:DNA-binding IclR family transcriptional regulator
VPTPRPPPSAPRTAAARPARAPAAPPKLVGALAAGLAVLRHLSRSPAPAGVSRIARDLSLNASTCFNLLRTLVHEGLVDFDDATKTYTLGLGAVELARGALDRDALPRLLQPALAALAARHSVTVLLWRRTPDDRLVLVHVAESPEAIRVQLSVGARLPLYAGASGRCMAAFGGASRSAVRRGFEPVRWDDPPSFDAFWASLATVREQGHAIDDGHYRRGATLVAAPVLDGAGRPMLAIACATFSAQLDAAARAALAGALVALADRATGALGGPRDAPTGH